MFNRKRYGRMNKAQFMHEYSRSFELQEIARQKGWDNGMGLTSGIYCLFCCFIASCWDGCSKCPCTDDSAAY